MAAGLAIFLWSVTELPLARRWVLALSPLN